MASSTRFVYEQADGTSSKPVGQVGLMTAAGRRIVVGEGPFDVHRGNGDDRPNLHRGKALLAVSDFSKRLDKGEHLFAEGATKREFATHRVSDISSYKDPFRMANVSAARIDAGVDKCGTGKVTAIGPGIIKQVGVPSHTSTFGSHLSSYELTAGPGKGLVVFFAEHYNIARGGFRVGDHVDTDTVLYIMNGCIEIGWATPDGLGSWAWSHVGGMPYSEGQLSIMGFNFDRLLRALGDSGGINGGRPNVGNLPPQYPADWKKALAA